MVSQRLIKISVIKIMNNIDAIKTMYKDNKVAKTLFDYFINCQNEKEVSSVDSLLIEVQKTGLIETPRSAVVHFLKQLAHLGYGNFRSGRKGKKSRIIWTVSRITLGRAAAGLSSTIQSLNKSEGTPATVPENEVGDTLMEVAFPLRPATGGMAIFRLPKNLTLSEAQRLSDFVKTLPVIQQ